MSNDARVHLRLPEQERSLLTRAALYSNQSISAFLRAVTVPAAEAIVKEHEGIVLQDEAWQRFSKALSDPPPPNKALLEAAADWSRSL